MTRSSLVFSIVTAPGVDGMVAMVLPLRRNRQWAPDGVVLTEICCVVPSMREAQPLTKAEHARSIVARDIPIYRAFWCVSCGRQTEARLKYGTSTFVP